MVGGLVLLNLLLVGGLLGWLLDLGDGSSESERESSGTGDGSGGEEDPAAETGPIGRVLAGTEGINELLTGANGPDTITGNPGDADTLVGVGGADEINLTQGDVAFGREGADIFRVSDGGQINDFVVGQDQLRLLNAVDPLNENAPDIWDWEIREDDVRLHRFEEGAVGDFSDETLVVTLQGLDAPPPVSDMVLFEIDDRQDEVRFVDGDEINFIQRLSSGSGNTAFDLSDDFSVWELEAGGGRDVVTFNSFRGTTDLGTGDDRYVSTARVVFDDPAFDPFEIVVAGEGQDTIVGGQSPMVADGGPGSDDITFGGGSTVTGGEGEDIFRLDTRTFAGSIGDEPEIEDFDPSEDQIVVLIDSGYSGAAVLSVEDDTLFLDGRVVLLLPGGAAADLTGISTLRV